MSELPKRMALTTARERFENDLRALKREMRIIQEVCPSRYTLQIDVEDVALARRHYRLAQQRLRRIGAYIAWVKEGEAPQKEAQV